MRRLTGTFMPIAGLAVWTAPAPAQPVPDHGIDWVTVGDPGNGAFPGGPHGQLEGRGSVDDAFRIGRTSITSGQWLEFVNTFAPQSDQPMRFLRPSQSGLQQVLAGRYRLAPDIADAEMVPVQGITWRDAAMYANWLHNDKSSDWSAIMDGAYDASTFTTNPGGTFNDQPTRHPDARFWIPSLDEWLKAAHYDPDHQGSGEGGWWLYPHSSDEPPEPGPPGIGETSAGEFDSPIPRWQIPLESYPDVQSPWGLLDVSGGASEWMEEINNSGGGEPLSRVQKGAWAGSTPGVLMWDNIEILEFSHPQSSGLFAGLRLASAIPGPSTAGAVLMGSLVMMKRRRTPTSNASVGPFAHGPHSGQEVPVTRFHAPGPSPHGTGESNA